MAGITTESAEGQRLQQVIKDKLDASDLADDDSSSIAEYVVQMIANDKSRDEITDDLVSLFGGKFDSSFTNWVFDTLSSVTQGPQAQPQAQPQRPTTSFDMTKTFIPGGSAPSLKGSFKGSSAGVKKSTSDYQHKSSMLGSHTLGTKSTRKRGEMISKGLQAEEKEKKDAEMGGVEPSDSSARVHIRKERCRHWPNCRYPNCKFIHPTVLCKRENCTMPKGTCTFIHPDDNVPLVGGKFDPIMYLQMQQFANPLAGGLPMPLPGMPLPMPGLQIPMPMPVNPIEAPAKPVVPCRFKEKCANEKCPFGHPTPCNNEAIMSLKVWCENKQDCNDPSCTKAHPSGSLVRAPEPIPLTVPEQCKFLDQCTNPHCRYRHPRTSTICRNGADCDRPDCFFSHPYKEGCKFGINCRNRNCLYTHPPERAEALKSGQTPHWVREGNSTSERRFTEDTDMVETIIPGQEESGLVAQ